jgi:pSer/pThr/pTyr-binding forkhead associated (FHA) protein
MSSLPPARGPVSPEAAAPPRPAAQVRCHVRPGVTLTFALKSDEALVGRDSGLAVAIPLDGVSRQHARIHWDGRAYWLEDLKSTNGTLLNGQRIVRERLRHLDVITLGKTAELIFVLRAVEPGVVRQRGIVRASLVADSADAIPHEIAIGEVTLGRSPACNIVAESGAVSKVHARIERTVDRLVLKDLGSSNGTFVNGTKVMTALLSDGDVLLLGGVEPFRVRIEMGEVTSGSGIRRRVALAELPEAEEEPRFSTNWKTRFEWDSGEREAIASLRQEWENQTTQKQGVVRPPAAGPPASAPRRAPTPKAPAPPSAARPAATPPAAAAPPPAPPVAGPAPAAAPTSMAEAAPDAATVVKPEMAPTAAPLAEVRLVGSDYDLVVTTPGTHVLGRATDAPLRVKHATVSRTHARVILSEDRQTASLEHAGGANGTRLNGRAIDKAEPLSDGDEIGVGEVTLKVALKRG